MSTQHFKIVLLLLMTTLWATPALSIERLVIPGTGDSQKLLREAARYFEQKDPNVIIDIPESVGSVGGIKRVLRSFLSQIFPTSVLKTFQVLSLSLSIPGNHLLAKTG